MLNGSVEIEAGVKAIRGGEEVASLIPFARDRKQVRVAFKVRAMLAI
jgi:hypothetical protein